MNSKKPQPSNTNTINLIKTVVLAVLAVVFTVLVTKVDVGTYTPEYISGAECVIENDATVQVGFATVNTLTHNAFGFSAVFYRLTELLGLLPFATIVFFVAFGVYQLAKSKNLKKVDKRLFFLAGFYVLVLALYVLFEKFALNFRPVVLDCAEGLEASYPSSHTLFAMTLCGSAILLANRLFGEKHAKLVKLGSLALTFLALAIVFGRALSGVHWLTDIVGGMLISAALVSALQTCIDYESAKSKRPRADN